jgi:Ala-tRNA(Pro) deacylase
MQCKERLELYLQDNQVPYQEQQHTRAFSARRIAESEHVSGKRVAKVVIVMVNDQMVSFVLPASFQIDFGKLQAILRTKEIRLASEAEFETAFPDCEVGSMPPFGNLYGLPVYVDHSLTTEESIIFPVGTYTDTMSLKYADFERLVHPQTAMFATTVPVA